MAVMFFEIIFYVLHIFCIFCFRYVFEEVTLSEALRGMASAKPVEWVAALITRLVYNLNFKSSSLSQSSLSSSSSYHAVKHYCIVSKKVKVSLKSACERDIFRPTAGLIM